jgi:hypothetical protein
VQPMKNGPEGPLTWCLPALATRNQDTPSTLFEACGGSACLLNSVPGYVLALVGCVMMVLHAVLVAADLTIQLVHQLVNGGIKVFMGGFDKDILALHMQRHFSLLSAILFLLVVATDRQIHTASFREQER